MPPRLFIRVPHIFEGAAEGRFAVGSLVFAFCLIAIIVAVRLFTGA